MKGDKREHTRKSWGFDGRRRRRSRRNAGTANATGRLVEVGTKSAFACPWAITLALLLRVDLRRWTGRASLLQPAVCRPRAWMVAASRRTAGVVGHHAEDLGTLSVCCSASGARLRHRLWSNCLFCLGRRRYARERT